MTSGISAKLNAFGFALLLNAFIFGGVAYLFDVQTQAHPTVFAVARQIVLFQWLNLAA